MESVLRFELDYTGKNGITLKKFDTLKKLDEFTRQFHDSNEVREKFFYEINEYLKSGEAINYLDSNLIGESSGYIREYCRNNYGSFCVPVIYNNNYLVNNNEIYRRIKENATKKRLKKLYENKMLVQSLPTPEYFRIELSRIYYRNGSIEPFVSNFIRYLKGLDDKWKYFYFRSLCHDFNLLFEDVKKTKIAFRIINIDRFHKSNEYVLAHNPYYLSKEELELDYFDRQDRIKEKEKAYQANDTDDIEFIEIFNRAVKNNDFNELFKYFTIEEIMNKSNYYDVQSEKRRK